jgi:hypothetical protein
MIHFALALAERLTGKKRPASGATPTPAEEHRNIAAEPVVLECPFCGTLGVCEHFIVEESPGKRSVKTFRPVNEIFNCAHCHQPLEADAFENDGTGTLRAKRWTCAQCATVNHVLRSTCAKCNAWRS